MIVRTDEQETAAKQACFKDCSTGQFVDLEAGCVSICKQWSDCAGWVPYLDKIINARFKFSNDDKAEEALRVAGFTVGVLQRSSPRGIVYGDEYFISKWRNLSPDDRARLHGIYQRHGPRGSYVRITIQRALVPAAALAALKRMEDADTA